MAAARGEGNASSASPSQSTVVFCGSPVPAVGNTTEEFSAAETVKTITELMVEHQQKKESEVKL